MKKFAGLIAFFALAAAAPAAPLVRDLGQGLAYCRVHVLPGDLATDASVANRPCVLDVRYVQGGDADAGLLLAWLKAHAGPRTPVFLLANSATSPILLAPLDSPDAVAGLVILGPATPRFSPDIAVKVSPKVERRDYDALEKGAPVTSLIDEVLDKPRVDEAKLTRDHLSDSAAPDDDEADAGDTLPPPSANPHPQLIDAVLQRAVQLHRALLAMRRL